MTGAAGGIGRRIALDFAAAGATVVVADVDAAGADATVQQAVRDGHRAASVRMDVTSAASVESALEAVALRHGFPDVLVAAAGIYPTRLLVEMTDQEWDAVHGVNVRGPFLLCRWLARRITDGTVPRTRRSIVVVSSGAARSGRIGASHYCSSKAAVEMLTRVAALELAPLGVTVNAVAPGLIDVPRVRELSPEYLDTLVAGQPVQRIGRPEHVARACLFLADDRSDYVTGAVLDVDGGFSAGRPLPLS
ncbi:SDR family NAD(P)-dependent oxidoreductase [Nakamurella endophytica]|uniref:SDR family NAD(P)-dependent oxidoreductase n=1 Tax=Nakamurella endophytica TaxID=1748367 RepID=UPI001E2E4149|nr:SDR family NAD(P)-dependent oxidoreductase [Nakamurella endophytica]